MEESSTLIVTQPVIKLLGISMEHTQRMTLKPMLNAQELLMPTYLDRFKTRHEFRWARDIGFTSHSVAWVGDPSPARLPSRGFKF